MKKIIYSSKILGGHSFVALILRLILGFVFFMHGAQKVLGWYSGGGLDGTVDFMTSVGIPPAMAYVASFWEFVGGICLILGFLSRVWALGLVVIMFIAILMVHTGFFVAQGGVELALTLMIVALSVFMLGSGKYSVDDAISSRENR